MESGGKAVTKRYRKKITVVLSLVLLVILLFAIIPDIMEGMPPEKHRSD